MADRLTRRRRACAARQHVADRSDPGGADHHTRAGLGSAFQPGGDARLRAPPRNRGQRGARLYRRADSWAASPAALLAHAMFELPILQISTDSAHRAGTVACRSRRRRLASSSPFSPALRFQAEAVPWLVGLYISAAYWFTASTSFANPAVAIARALTDTFCRYPPGRSAGLRRRRVVRGAARNGLREMVVRRPETDRRLQQTRSVTAQGEVVPASHRPSARRLPAHMPRLASRRSPRPFCVAGRHSPRNTPRTNSRSRGNRRR